MIRIQIFRDNEARITGFRVTGHAGTAPQGEDIICAGVSALTQSALLGLERWADRQMNLTVESGKLIMDLTSEPDSLTQAILETMVLGLTAIADNYPKNVSLVSTGGDKNGFSI